MVISCNCLSFCFSSLSCHAITGSNPVTGEKRTGVDRVWGFPGETGKTEVAVLFPFLGGGVEFQTHCGISPTCQVETYWSQPQLKLCTFRMEPTLVLELIQDCWLPLTRNWTEPMPGYNNCQNIHVAYVPHNADGERGKMACHQHHSATEWACCFIQCPEIQIDTDVRAAVNPSMYWKLWGLVKAPDSPEPGCSPTLCPGTAREAEQKPPCRLSDICTPLPVWIKLYATENTLWVKVWFIGLTLHRPLCFP